MVDFFSKDWTENDVLLLQAKDGCQRSLNEVLIRSREHVLLLVARHAKSSGSLLDVEDIVQDISIVICRDLNKCKAATWNEFRCYLMVVCRNKTIHAVEKVKAKKRGGDVSIFNLADRSGRVGVRDNAWLEATDLDELMTKLEAIAKENEKHRAVLESYIECIDLPCTSRIPLAQRKMGCTRSETYSANKRFKSVCGARLNRRHDPELVEAVRDDLKSGQCRKSMCSCYGLTQSQLDEIELSR